MIQINVAVFIAVYALAAALKFFSVLLAVLVSLQLHKVLQMMQRYEGPRFRLACHVVVFLINTILIYFLSFKVLVGVFINYLNAAVADVFYGNLWSRIMISLVLSFILVPAIIGDLVLEEKRESPS